MASYSPRVFVLFAAVLPCLGRPEAEGSPVDHSGRIVVNGLEPGSGPGAPRAASAPGVGADREAFLVDTEGGLHRLDKQAHARHRHQGTQGHGPAQQAPASAALLRREAPTRLVEVPLPQGVRGEQGDQGVAGPQGPKGSVGERGPQGAPGLAGATGPRGFSGRDGRNGAPASKPVPVDCVWEDWTVFSPCDKTCGKHARKRRDRNVLVFPQSGGKNCDGGSFQFVACGDVDCPPPTVLVNVTVNKSMVSVSSKHKKNVVKKAKKKVVVVTALPKKKHKKKGDDDDDDGSL